MKNFIRTIFASALFCLAMNFFAFSVNAQTSSTTDAVPPVTVQAPTPAPAAPAGSMEPANVPPPSVGIKVAPGTETQAAPLAAEHQKATAHKTKRHAKHHKARHHAKKKTKHARSKKNSAAANLRDHVRTAQTNLDMLGYNPGPVDGLAGPKTRAAVKAFQTDHKLKVTGKLDSKTFDLLSEEAIAAANKKKLAAIENGGEVAAAPQPPPEFFAKHPDYYGYYNREYANPNQMGSPQVIPTRFGDMQINNQTNGTVNQYVISLNGQPVFHADGQPSVVNLSRTFNLDSADAIVLTSYAGGDNTCPYRHYLLVVRLNSNGVHEIGNCTRAYEAYTQSGSLYISFPGQHVDGWSSGDTWRYENGTLQRL